MIQRHLDAKKKQSMDVEGVYNWSLLLSPTWLHVSQISGTVEWETSPTRC